MNYTSIKQSKKLLELGLKSDSADMWYHGHGSHLESDRTYDDEPAAYHSRFPNFDFPCWSAGALANLLPSCETIHDSRQAPFDKTFAVIVSFTNGSWFKTAYYESLLDAVYECICKMIQDGWLKKKLKEE